MLRHINQTANSIYKDWKYRLHQYFQNVGPVPPPVELRGDREDEWEWLCNHFQEEGFKVRC